MVKTSYEILLLAKKKKPFSDGDIIKQSLTIFAQNCNDQKVKAMADSISLSRNTVMRRVEEMSTDIISQITEFVTKYRYFSLALDETCDLTANIQLEVTDLQNHTALKQVFSQNVSSEQLTESFANFWKKVSSEDFPTLRDLAMQILSSHILQPLDVGVFRPLKAAWRAELQNYKIKHPSLVPTKHDFYKFQTPVYEKCFTPTNNRAGFSKAGIYSLNKNAVCSDAIAPSKLSDQPVITGQDSMEEITIGIDYDDEIPHSGLHNDPLCDGEVKENDDPSISSTSLFEKSQTQNDEPLVLQMECELEPITNTELNILTTDYISRPQNKNKIIHDILTLPKCLGFEMAHRMSDNAIASALSEESDDDLDELFLPGSEDESDHLSVQSECECEEEEE
ncbi:unnamed protein product [Parnassius apollo]|uniref:(apollo) hypothetical protein n=1 Tax=Parnassius apollo TaxID=110799 RepID=A0A8S3YA87_PARAO|nr:unnamed protein product [Parnassius apollo]